MALPVKQKVWTFPAINVQAVNAGGDLTAVRATMLLALKNALKTMSGVTVKGSSNKTTAGMDGIDRWATVADISTNGNAPQAASWIVLKFANMGGAELLIDLHTLAAGGVGVNMWISPGGLFTGAAVNAVPTATDSASALVSSIDDDINQTNSRYISCGITGDGSAFYFVVARNGVFTKFFAMQLAASVVGGTATFAPAVVGVTYTTRPAALSTMSGTNYLRARASGSTGGVQNLDLRLGYETFGNNGKPAPSALNAQQALQDNEFLIGPLSLWSTTVNANGKLANLVDLWTGIDNGIDGATYPIDGDREFISVGPLVLPWDGVDGVPGTLPQMI